MRKQLLILILLWLCGMPAVAQKRTEKVLFIIADGIPAAILKKAPVPNLRKIAAKGAWLDAYVGGEKERYSQTPTISAVGYNSLLTGTWVNKHNVWDNDIAAPNYHYPTIFRLFKDRFPERKTAVFSSWTDNRTKLIGEDLPETGQIRTDSKADGYELDTLNFPHDAARDFMHRIDEKVTDEAVRNIRDTACDLNWVYLEYTDDMGHKYGYGPQFSRAIGYMDAQVGRIWDAIRYREKNFREDWLIIITTDHGRDSVTGKNHGGQSDAERATWIVTNVKTNLYSRSQPVAITDILPTIARFLSLPIPQKNLQETDGVPLIGDVAIADPHARYANGFLTVSWKPFVKSGRADILLSETNAYAQGGTDQYNVIGKADISAGKITIPFKNYAPGLKKILIRSETNTLNYWVTIK